MHVFFFITSCPRELLCIWNLYTYTFQWSLYISSGITRAIHYAPVTTITTEAFEYSPRKELVVQARRRHSSSKSTAIVFAWVEEENKLPEYSTKRRGGDSIKRQSAGSSRRQKAVAAQLKSIKPRERARNRGEEKPVVAVVSLRISREKENEKLSPALYRPLRPVSLSPFVFVLLFDGWVMIAERESRCWGREQESV